MPVSIPAAPGPETPVSVETAGRLSQKLYRFLADLVAAISDQARSSLVVSDRDELRALDIETHTFAFLTEAGRRGQFIWDGSDLSGTLVTRTVTSTSVAGNVFTKADHGLVTGQAGVVTVTANGLTTNTKYWFIRLSSSTFSMATSLSNANNETAIALTGTTNQTFQRLLDSAEGFFVIAIDGALNGSGGAWRRVHVGPIQSQWFGITGGGSDEWQAIWQAVEFADAARVRLEFPEGTFGFGNPIYFYRGGSLFGAHPEKTIFKYLSSSGTSIKFERHGAFGPETPQADGTSYAHLGRFTLDQDGSNGDGLYIGAQYTLADDIIVKNQAGGGFMLKMEGCTLANLPNIHLGPGTNGLYMASLFYPHFGSLSVETTTGRCIEGTGVICPTFEHIFLGTQENAGASRVGPILFSSSETILFKSLNSELADNDGMSENAYFQFTNCNGVHVLSGRVNHESSTTTGKAIFGLSGTYGFSVDKTYWIDDNDGMSFVRTLTDGAYGVSINNCLANNTASGARNLLTCDSGVAAEHISIKNWIDKGSVCTAMIRADFVLTENTNATLTFEAGTIHTAVNCRGTINGTVVGALVRVNS